MSHRIDNVDSSQLLEQIIQTSDVNATPDTIVLRDGTGGVTASAVNCSLVTTDSIEAAGTTLNVGSDLATQTLNLGCGSSVQTVNIGTSVGVTTINLGAAGDTVAFAGTVTAFNTTTLDVADQQITLNKGGVAASGGNAGIFIEESGVDTAYVKVSADRTSMLIKAPLSSEVTVGNTLVVPTTLTVAGLDLTPQLLTVTGTWTGPHTTITLPVTFLRVGNIVHMTINANPASVGTSTPGLSQFTFSNPSAVPNEMRPRYNNGVTTGPTVRQIALVKNGSLLDEVGAVVVEPNTTNIDGTIVSLYGAIRVQLTSGTFSGTGVGWVFPIVIQYQNNIIQ